ncbi:MAG: L-aspartate oxidase [Chitinophagales bacterium]
MAQSADFLIVGSGIAGLTMALKFSEKFPDKSIKVITKADEDESNTKYAQGGVAVVSDFDHDSFKKHIEDTLNAGDGLCDKAVVEQVIKNGPARIREIIEWGTEFDKDESGAYHLGKEGGHTENRVLHHKDVTGKEIERALLAKVHASDNIEVYQHHFVLDLITQHHTGSIVTRVTDGITCFGVYVLNTQSKKVERILSKLTVLASGGVGQVYKSTTNPSIATGDGLAMLYRAKGRVENMEFIQFHPTSLYNPGESPSFLITEAVRGAGAKLRDISGREFMYDYDKRGALAPRDIVARAIDNELKKSGEEFVYLDATEIPNETFRNHFPNIYNKCCDLGIDVSKEGIPVVPAAHYSCGGIKVNEKGETSIENLYACGECASTGLHGANRLASNSLLEALVYAHLIYENAVSKIDYISLNTGIPEWDAAGTTEPGELVLITQSLKELRDIMSSYVGIVRSNVRLKRALDRLYLLYTETEELYENAILSPQLCELRNMITVAYLICRCSSMRRESRGLHFTTDYPQKSNHAENTLL